MDPLMVAGLSGTVAMGMAFVMGAGLYRGVWRLTHRAQATQMALVRSALLFQRPSSP
jgi:hypothetical protein